MSRKIIATGKWEPIRYERSKSWSPPPPPKTREEIDRETRADISKLIDDLQALAIDRRQLDPLDIESVLRDHGFWVEL